MKKHFLIIPVFVLLYFFSGCSNSTEPNGPKVFEDKLEFRAKKCLELSCITFEYNRKDTYELYEKAYPLITLKNKAKYNTKLWVAIIASNGDSVYTGSIFVKDTNKKDFHFDFYFFANTSRDFKAKAFEVVGSNMRLIDSCKLYYR